MPKVQRNFRSREKGEKLEMFTAEPTFPSYPHKISAVWPLESSLSRGDHAQPLPCCGDNHDATHACGERSLHFSRRGASRYIKLQSDHQWRCSIGLDDQLERLLDPPFTLGSARAAPLVLFEKVIRQSLIRTEYQIHFTLHGFFGEEASIGPWQQGC